MDKKRKFEKIENFAAGIITWHDETQIKFDKWLVRAFATFINATAAVISIHDNIQARIDRIFMIIKYHISIWIHKFITSLEGQTKKIMANFTVILLTALTMVAVMNYATGFEYFYNGKSLGYTRHQDDVLKILNLVSEQLSQETGVKINISEESDIEFKPVFILDKDPDDMDTVLKRFTYMTDTRAEGYGIFINGKRYVVCKDISTADSVLRTVQKEYLSKKKNVEYVSIGFTENVEIKAVNVKLKTISSMYGAKKAIMSGGEKEIQYTVKSGDAISTICEKYDISVDQLKDMNPDLNINLIHEGDKLLINKATSAVTVKTVSIEKYGEKIKHKTKYVENDDMYNTQSNVIQKGSDGKRAVVAEVTRINGEKTDTKVVSETIITEAVTEIIEKGTKEPPKTMATGQLSCPVPGLPITSYFGYRWGRLHEGLDYGGPIGTTIHAADGGKVVMAGWNGAYGICVIIDHENGIKTLYAHNSSTLVSVGDRVYKGQPVALSGSTGRSTGPHIHFEVIVNGSTVDPLGYI